MWKKLADTLGPSRQRWAMFLYPLMLVLLEIIMKALLSIGPGTVLGPSLSAVGACYVIPLTVKKPLTLKKLEQLKAKLKPDVYDALIPLYSNGTISYMDNEKVRDTAFAFILILTVMWAIVLLLTIHTPKYGKPPQDVWWAVPLTIILGVSSCVVGLILTEWSERGS